MSLSKLEEQLWLDTETEAPPFGAECIILARELGSAATPVLLKHVKNGDETAFLSLEALRAADPDAFQAIPTRDRAGIYVRALKSNLFYNTWGLPGYHITETAQALIALGEEAVLLLKPLLDDWRLAPLSGSEDATASSIYANRVRDYAWILIAEIKRQPYQYFQTPAERDKQIGKLLKVLE